MEVNNLEKGNKEENILERVNMEANNLEKGNKENILERVNMEASNLEKENTEEGSHMEEGNQQLEEGYKTRISCLSPSQA